MHGGDESGTGHPGFSHCTSTTNGVDTISTVSKDGTWAWEWLFREDYAELAIKKHDPDRAYWFLYEGPPGGHFDEGCYWGNNNEGPLGFHFDGMCGNWQWAYFGNKAVKRIFYVAQEKYTSSTDFMWWLSCNVMGPVKEGGMAVFGFGRTKDTKGCFCESGKKFIIGFIDKKVSSENEHKAVSADLQSLLA